MLDNALIALVISTVLAQEVVANIPGTPIKQAFQPTQQGVNTGPTAYMFKLGDHRLGSPYRAELWNAETETMEHTEIQQYETTFQISALSTQNPANTAQYTASDILNLIAYILQSTKTVEILQENEVGILKIGDVRNPYFGDDRARNEAAPSFDFTLVHKQIVQSTSNVIESTEFGLYPI